METARKGKIPEVDWSNTPTKVDSSPVCTFPSNAH